MEEEKFSIVNDNELEVKGTIFRPKRAGKFPVVVFSYDFLDSCDTLYIKELAKLYLEAGVAVVRFDFSHGFGKSAGRAEHMTTSARARDLELVIEYVKRRSYIHDTRVAIIGFGFGAMAGLLLEGFQAVAKAIVLVNAPYRVEDTTWTRFDEREMVRVKLKRYFHVIRDGEEVRVNYSFYEDGARIDMFRCARNLRTPVLYVAGLEDAIISPEHSRILFERTNGKKELDIVAGFGHDIGKKQTTMLFEKSFAFLKKNRVV